MRLAGYPVGYIPEKFDPPSKLTFHHPFNVDSLGGHSLRELLYDNQWMNDKLNPQGYVSPYDFSDPEDLSKDSSELKILLIGDSYTLGYDANPLDSSFAVILNEKLDLKVYNTGVFGMDPVQYRLMAERFIPQIQPDRVVIPICLQNDLMCYQRKPRPFAPLWYKVEGFSYMATEIFDGEKVIQFSSFQESYDWYLEMYTLLGKSAPLYERLLGKTALGTMLLLPQKIKTFESKTNSIENQYPHTRNELKRIQEICHEQGVPVIFLAIPSPVDLQDGEDIRKKYGFALDGLGVHYPPQDLLSESDYNSVSISGHFINSGHAKFAEFIYEAIQASTSPDNK